MYLTKEEEQILNGDAGETLRQAIEILVTLGDIYGADRLIPIKSAQIAGVSYKTMGDAGLEWISDLQGKVKVPAILNCRDGPARLGTAQDLARVCGKTKVDCSGIRKTRNSV